MKKDKIDLYNNLHYSPRRGETEEDEEEEEEDDRRANMKPV